MHARLKGGIVQSILRTPGIKREERRARERAHELLALCSLAGRANRYAHSLPYGDQRRLEVARALATEPKLLLLDEPTAGMNPQETADFTAFVQQLRSERKLTVLLIEHDMKVVMGVSDRVTVLDYGEKIAEGTPREVQKRPARDRGLPRQGRPRPRWRLRERVAAAQRPMVLEVEAIDAFYGSIQALRGHHARRPRGRDRDADRRERRRQVVDAARDQRRPPSAQGKIRFEGRTSRGPRRTRSSSAGSRSRRRGGGSSAHDGHREPRDGRLPAQGQGGDPRGHGPRLRALPAAAGAARPEGGDDVRAASSRCARSGAR